jgi:hypothetical protein
LIQTLSQACGAKRRHGGAPVRCRAISAAPPSRPAGRQRRQLRVGGNSRTPIVEVSARLL